MRYFIHFLLDPLIISVFLAGIAGLNWYFNKKYISKIFLGITGAWLFVITISPVPSWLVRHLEKQYKVVSLDEIHHLEDVHIIILGGGHSIAPGLPPANQLSYMALGRLAEGIRLHRQMPGSKMVLSGYSRSGRVTQAEMLALTALDLGILPMDTLLLTKPSNTEAEAREYAARFGNNHTLVLVTDAIHMPRATKWFRNFGLHPIPAPTNHHVKIDPDRKSFPFKLSAGKITLMSKAIHEWVGLLEVGSM